MSGDVIEVGDAPQPPVLVAQRHQILALSGGGFRGLFTADLLVHLEAVATRHRTDARLRDSFDVIAGTSAGAILAAGVALGLDAATLRAAFRNGASDLFRTRAPPLRFARRLVTAPYSIAALRTCIATTLGAAAKTTLDKIDAPLLIAAVSEGERKPQIFRSRGLARAKADAVPVGEAILASAAAPTYFGPVKIGQQTLIDGGLVANAPDLLAVCDALALKRRNLAELYMLSIGTASPHAPGRIGAVGAPGVIAWMLRRSLVHLTLGAQERLAVELAGNLLGPRYLRLDEAPLEAELKHCEDMDNIGPHAEAALTAIAQRCWQRVGARAEAFVG